MEGSWVLGEWSQRTGVMKLAHWWTRTEVPAEGSGVLLDRVGVPMEGTGAGVTMDSRASWKLSIEWDKSMLQARWRPKWEATSRITGAI